MDIKGYRELTDEDIAAINEVKNMGRQVELLIQELTTVEVLDVDKRWAAIAVTHFQEGFMALTRAIAKPSTFA